MPVTVLLEIIDTLYITWFINQGHRGSKAGPTTIVCAHVRPPLENFWLTHLHSTLCQPEQACEYLLSPLKRLCTPNAG